MKEHGISKQSFVKGAFILGLAGIVTRVIGAFFRIPLGNILSLEAMGYYSAAYTIYGFFLVLATSGLPTAIAKLVSEFRASENQNGIKSTFKTGAVLMTAIGAIGFIITFFFSGIIVKIIGNPGAEISLKTLAPAVFMVTFMSLYRGYFQGYQNMGPFGLSMILEQIARVIVGYSLALILISKGPQFSAAGATSGATSGAIMGVIVVLFSFKSFNRRMGIDMGGGLGILQPPQESMLDHTYADTDKEKTVRGSLILKSKKGENDTVAVALSSNFGSGEVQPSQTTGFSLSLLKRLFKIAVPITIGASVLPLLNLIDVGLVIQRLQDAGFDYDRANEMFGMLTGYAATMVNLPQALTSAVQISIVPAVTAYFTMKSKQQLQGIVENGLKITALIAMPSAAGLSILSTRILSLLYPSHADDMVITGGILAILGISVLFLGLFQVTTGVLQGIGRQNMPAINLSIAVLLKLVLTFIFVGIPALNIYGAAVATILAYLLALILNFRVLIASLDFKIRFWEIFKKPAFATIIMSAAVIISTWVFTFIPEKLGTIVSIFIGMGVFVVVVFATSTLNDEDYELIPGGSKLKALEAKIFRRKD